MDELEAANSKVTLWEWTREWLDEPADERCELAEYLWLRSENETEMAADRKQRGTNMKVTYELEFSATCPIDRSVRDDYKVWIEADEMIKVEDLKAILDEYRQKTMFQEDITQDIASRVAAVGKVTTVGHHSGVKTTCIARL